LQFPTLITDLAQPTACRRSFSGGASGCAKAMKAGGHIQYRESVTEKNLNHKQLVISYFHYQIKKYTFERSFYFFN
jgi:hypothetical protein